MSRSFQQPQAGDDDSSEDDVVKIGPDDVSNYNPDNILPESPGNIERIRQWLKPTQYDIAGGEYRRHLDSHLDQEQPCRLRSRSSRRGAAARVLSEAPVVIAQHTQGKSLPGASVWMMISCANMPDARNKKSTGWYRRSLAPFCRPLNSATPRI